MSAVLCLFLNTAEIYAAWYINTDTGVSVAMDDVDYMIRADDAEKFTIVLKNGETIEGVGSVSFIEHEESGNRQLETVSEVRFYPNPVTDYLHITGVQSGTSLKVVSLDGSVVKSLVTDSPEVFLSVSDLSHGTYILHVAERTLKFVKK